MSFFDQKHGLTHLEKYNFLGLSKLLFLYSKKVSFLSGTFLNLISSLILSENKKMKKLAFLDQNYGLTPLEKFDF